MRPNPSAFLVVGCVFVVGLQTPTAEAEHVTHVHASQRYDRSIPLLARDIRRITAQPVDLVTLTEVQARARAREVHRPRAWRAYTAGRTDVAVMWRRTTWRLVRATTYRLTRTTYRTTNGFHRTTWGMAVVLDSRATGRRVLVTLAHLPSGVQFGDRFRPTTPVRNRVWRESLAGWHTKVAALRHRFRPAAVLTVADWNVDVRRPVWRRTIARAFPSQHPTWRPPLPRRGTHGRDRLIDATWTTETGRARLLPHTAASDHTAYRERLTLDGPRR